MNNFYEEIKSRSFKYHDDFYHIHGSHRNRDLNTHKSVNPRVSVNNLNKQNQYLNVNSLNPIFHKNTNYVNNFNGRKMKMII
jgi:hypothetical protein